MAYVTTVTSSCLIFIINFFNAINAYAIYDNNGLGIISGHPINITQVPFMAIFDDGCGASIVHEQFLVTACHCVFGTSAEGKSVFVGTDKRNEGEKYETEKGFCHPKFNPRRSNYSVIAKDTCNFEYDIAVLKLKKKLTFSEKVNVIKMADSSVAFKNGDVFETIGFGMTSVTSQPSNVLLAVNISLVEQDECRKVIGDEFVITDRMICAGGGSPYHGPSWGDSGSALLFNGLLLGVVSCGPHCEPNKPAIFSSVPALKDFVDKTIKENQ